MTVPPPSISTDRRLLDAVVSVADGLELESTLRRIVRAASDLTGAPFAALGVLDENGLHRAFVHTGIDSVLAEQIGHLPRGHGVFGHITRVGRPVRVTEIGDHPASAGFPANHPPMHSFLGVPVGIGERVVGNLYLADKAGGFTVEDEDVVVALAAAAAVAVDNAGLYEEARRRERWMAAGHEVATAMLSGTDEDEALHLIAERAMEVSGACTAALVLSGWGGQWVLEIAEGFAADSLIGTVLPPGSHAERVARSGHGIRVRSVPGPEGEVAPEEGAETPAAIAPFGPALYAPLASDGEHMGVLVLLRRKGEAEFTDADLAPAQAFATQAALALQLADGRRRSEEAELLEDRARIARDLHDLVVQELFALGMRLNRLKAGADTGMVGQIDTSLESLDRVVRQIRSTIRALRDPEERDSLTDRLHAEAERSQLALGFLPTLTVDPPDADHRVPDDVVDDAVAVVRECLSNCARHARAGHVEIQVRIRDHGAPQETDEVDPTGDGRAHLTICVVDDGVGLPTTLHRESGLNNLSERARAHGGSFRIEPATTGGTRATWVALLSH